MSPETESTFASSCGGASGVAVFVCGLDGTFSDRSNEVVVHTYHKISTYSTRVESRAPGKRLRTLRDAGEHIAALPKKELDRSEWQTALEALLLIIEHGGPTMFARIGLCALKYGKSAPEVEPRRKKARVYRVIR